MSTIVPVTIEEGDNYDSASINSAVTGVSDGVNALAEDDHRTEGYGYKAVHPIGIDTLTTGVVKNMGRGFSWTNTCTNATTTWGVVSFNNGGTPVDAEIVMAGSGLDLGATSTDYVGKVLVGMSCEAYNSAAGTSELAFGVLDSVSSPTVNPIAATTFPITALVSSADRYQSMEFVVTESDLTVGSLLERLYLMGKSDGVVTLNVVNVQIWAIPLHSEG